MKVLKNLKLVGVSILLLGGLAACDKSGPAESAGKKVDQAASDASNKIADTADKVADKLDEQGNKAGVAINDAEITTWVKAAIFAEPTLKTLQISVDTIKGVVTLSGSVDTQESADRARSLTAAVSGVNEVNNHLDVKSNK
jgi:osmotically-inducible protein OsmY